MNPQPSVLSRRRVLAGGAGFAGLLALDACGVSSPQAIGPHSAAVRRAAQKRLRPGAPMTSVQLVAAPGTVDLGGRMASTWLFDGQLPAREIRVPAGSIVRADVRNGLPSPTTVHWHGIAVRNDMDGVPAITQQPIAAGGDFRYEFVVPDPGTYWFHPHVGVQLDRGLYGPLIVEDPAEPGRYDDEWVLVLDDWTDGIGQSPDAILRRLTGSGMGGMGGMAAMRSSALGGDAGDVRYPGYLINGCLPAAPRLLNAQPGDRIRLRIINAGGDTAFRVALAGHRLTVTHTDGFPVRPVTVDSVLIGMGERCDALVTLHDGVFPLVASAEGKNGLARALVRTGSGSVPAASFQPVELTRRLLGLADLSAADADRLPKRTTDQTHDVVLGGDMAKYRWTLNGRTYDKRQPLGVQTGQRVRLAFTNRTTMFHPMHLHGHTFQVVTGEGDVGPRKDTVIVKPGQRILVDFDADNPGQWLTHCHNVYHGEAGMMTVVSYQR